MHACVHVCVRVCVHVCIARPGSSKQLPITCLPFCASCLWLHYAAVWQSPVWLQCTPCRRMEDRTYTARVTLTQLKRWWWPWQTCSDSSSCLSTLLPVRKAALWLKWREGTWRHLGRKIPEWTAVCISVPFYYLQERQHCDLPDEEVLGPGWDRPGWTAAFVMVGCSVISTETQEHTDTNKARKLNQHQQTHKTHTTHCLTCETLTSEILREKNTVSMPSTNALLSSDRCTEITAITLLPHGHIIFVPNNFVSSFGQSCHLQMPTKKQVHFQSADK